MKKIALVGLIVVAAAVMPAPPADADGRRHHGHRHGFHGHRHGFHGHHHSHSRVVIGFGPSFYWGPPPYWYYPRPYVVYSAPPVVVQETPPVYIQQQPPPVAPAPTVEQYWYYCQSAGGYYPSVPSCPEAWVQVPPRP
jgi:hypothetical protein